MLDGGLIHRIVIEINGIVQKINLESEIYCLKMHESGISALH